MAEVSMLAGAAMGGVTETAGRDGFLGAENDGKVLGLATILGGNLAGCPAGLSPANS